MIEFVPVFPGDSGELVAILQTILHILQFTGADGRPLAIDGNCGDNTVAAINKFQSVQRAYGYECGTDGKNDSIFGLACWARVGVI